MRVEADRELCIGSGVCADVSAVFALDEEGKVRVLVEGELPPAELAGVEEAVSICPVQALAVRRAHISRS